MLSERKIWGIAKKAYTELHGEAWVREHRGTLGSEWSTIPDENGEIVYTIIEDECNRAVEFSGFEEWKHKLDEIMARQEIYNWRPRHSTTMFINAETGKVRFGEIW